MTNKEFADSIDVTLEEAEKLLNGESVQYETARKFIYWMTGVIAHNYIDWEAMGIKDPLINDGEDEDEEE